MSNDESSQEKMRYLKYLATCKGGKEHYRFDEQSDASEFGNKLREIIAEEEGIGFWELDHLVSVRISYLIVRIELNVSVEDYVNNY